MSKEPDSILIHWHNQIFYLCDLECVISTKPKLTWPWTTLTKPIYCILCIDLTVSCIECMSMEEFQWWTLSFVLGILQINLRIWQSKFEYRVEYYNYVKFVMVASFRSLTIFFSAKTEETNFLLAKRFFWDQ